MSSIKYYWDSFPLTRMKWESLGVAQSSGIWERPPVFKHAVVPLLLSQPRWLTGEPLLPGDSGVPCPGTHPTSPLTLLRRCWRDDSPGGHTGTPSLGCQELCFGDILCDWLHIRTAIAAETTPLFDTMNQNKTQTGKKITQAEKIPVSTFLKMIFKKGWGEV